jgi:hypothetical protein
MGFFDTWSDLVAAATPWTAVEAEAVSGGSSTEKTPAQKDDGGEGEAKVSSFSLDYGAYCFEFGAKRTCWRGGIWNSFLWRALLQPEVVGANLWIWKGTLSSI